VIFSAPFKVPGDRRIENGITGTVSDVNTKTNRVLIRTDERESREVEVDSSKFSDLNLSYAVHVYKAQGITAESAEVLIGGWQTDREGAYVALSRARERTQIYVSREDLSEAGMNIGAIERLGERIRQSRAQEASIAKKTEERIAEHQAQIERELGRDQNPDRGFGII
jgi:ATP-dependent exoDNAse (exonuclease V) alpha subunit